MFILFLDHTEPPTIETIDAYMLKLSYILKTENNPSLIVKVKKAIASLNFSQF